ncbi:hypothetical protein CHS0354_043118 [Potamilus streckersoni]|uniref:Enoyl-CoA delta isomerase 1, mitochondrial n=1 Tax=Potamilus streckersoni TaxID=2493646 RepID=A0AAE0SC25_9BIVA|nr:hypothetical protein CHS0354_043118 [Potamilus streckersoni]
MAARMAFSRLTRSLCEVGRSRSLLLQSARWVTSASKTLTVTMDDKTGIAEMSLNRPPVNSLSLEFMTEINIALEKLEHEKFCRGVIITSAIPKIFSAGLDILEMYQPKPERLSEFWKTLQDMWLLLFGSRLTTIAAINGHSPAGGALVAMSCDYRIMAPGFNIGLNETQLGIVPPFWFIDTMMHTIGSRQTELCCQKGLMLSTEEAARIGLVDKVVPLDQIASEAKAEMQSWLKIPVAAKLITKQTIRAPILEKLQTRQEADVQNFCNFAMKDSVQKSLGMYLENLKKKQKE